MYMLIAATLFQEYEPQIRLDYIKRYYDAISKHKINIPTPIMAGVRTPLRQFASCVLVDVDDTLNSIFSSDKSETEKYSTQVLYRSSKSLKALSDAALKMALEVDQRLSTSPSGIKK